MSHIMRIDEKEKKKKKKKENKNRRRSAEVYLLECLIPS